jgi:hypothetical protein
MTLQQTPIDASESSSSDELALVRIPPEKVAGVWPLVAPLLEKPIRMLDGALTEKTVYERGISGHFQIWAVLERDGTLLASMVTQVLLHEACAPTCVAMLLGGRQMDRWLYLIGELEAWATQEGCGAIELGGRKGWSRVLPGYRQVSIVLRKDL